MANIELSLSTKSREDGKRQILVRISRGRSIRFRYKSGIYVSADYWSEEERCIRVPVFRKINKASVETAKAEKAALDSFVAELDSIICASDDIPGAVLSAEWIDHCLALRPILEDRRNGFLPSMANGLFTATNIERAERIAAESRIAESREAENQERSRILYDLIPDYCQARNLRNGCLRGYRVLARMLGRYEMFVRLTDRRRNDFTLVVSKVSSVDIEGFRNFIRNEGSLQEQYPKIFEKILVHYPQTENPTFRNRSIHDRGENYICIVMKRLKALCAWCRETGRTDIEAFRGVEMGSEQYGTPYYITREERDRIADFDLSSAPLIVQQQRDIFVFHCLIGCRVSDLYTLTSDNIQDGMLRYSPRKTEDKTGMIARVPLTDRALSILEKYEGVDRKGRLLPFIAEQKYNDYIKQIFVLCGITRKIVWRNPTTGKGEMRPISEVASSHLARRTFCGNLYRQVKDPNLIGAMSGHTAGSRAFARYRNIDDDILTEIIKSSN